VPNIKSAKKRVLQSEKSRKRNFARKSLIKTAVKKVQDAIANKQLDVIKDLLKKAESVLARAAGKKVLHRATVRRKISRLAKRAAEATRTKAT